MSRRGTDAETPYFDRSASSCDAYVSRAYEAGNTAQLQQALLWQKEMKVQDVGTGTGYLALPRWLQR